MADLETLGVVIKAHGMQDAHRVHLVHRHFDMPPGHVVASTLSKDGLEVRRPVPVLTIQALPSTHFFVKDHGTHWAFEAKAVDDDHLRQDHAMEDSTHAAFEQAFEQAFARAVLSVGLQTRVALTLEDGGVKNQRQIVGEDWAVHSPCGGGTQKFLDAKSIAVGWPFEGGSGKLFQCTNWYLVPSHPDSHRVGSDGDSIEPLIEADGIVEYLRAREMICCARGLEVRVRCSVQLHPQAGVWFILKSVDRELARALSSP